MGAPLEPKIIPTLKVRTLAERLRDLIETKADTKYKALIVLLPCEGI
jgi:hypothetical protein